MEARAGEGFEGKTGANSTHLPLNSAWWAGKTSEGLSSLLLQNCSLVQSFNKYLLSSCYVPGTLPGTGGTAMNKDNILVGETDIKQNK